MNIDKSGLLSFLKEVAPRRTSVLTYYSLIDYFVKLKISQAEKQKLGVKDALAFTYASLHFGENFMQDPTLPFSELNSEILIEYLSKQSMV